MIFQHKKSLVGAAALIWLGLLTGCAPGTTATANQSSSSHVSGGQQPVSGARIYLLAAGATGLRSASTSLLVPSRSGVSTDSAGRGYVTSDSNGGFTLTGDYDACTDSTSPVYLLALGGNPGLAAGTDNAALALAAAAGTCGSLGPARVFNLNELTTVAFANAFAAYAADAFTIGVPSNLAGALADAEAAATALVDPARGTASASTGRAANPVAAANSFANALAPCVNSAGASSSACAALTSLTGASDTLSAAFSIASSPAAHVSALYALAPASPPFQPVLAQAPADWTLAPQLPSTLPAVAGLTAFGDSISTVAGGNGASPVTLGYTQLLANYLGGPFTNHSQGGDESIDAAQKAFYYGLPTDTGNPPATLMIGTNDVYFEDPGAAAATHEQVYRETTMATLSLSLTPPANKLFPDGNAACSGAGWSSDGSLPGAGNGRGVYTSAVGLPFTCTYTTTGAPIYFWHLISGDPGAGTVLIDGSLCGSFVNNYPSYTGSHNGVYNSVAALRCPVAAGTHTVTVTLTASGSVAFEGLGTPSTAALTSAPPHMFTMAPLHQLADTSATATDLYAQIFNNLAAQMTADGYLVQPVNVRDHILYTGTADPSSTGASGSSCMANQLHPSNCGHSGIFTTLQSQIPKAP